MDKTSLKTNHNQHYFKTMRGYKEFFLSTQIEVIRSEIICQSSAFQVEQ
jgi:hypothetical protein